jgi:hypothetical protein
MWAREQPKRGDLVLHCGHLCPEYECGQACAARGFHWYDAKEFADSDGHFFFVRGDSLEPRKARWGVLCQTCLMKQGPPNLPDFPGFPGERHWQTNLRRVIAAERKGGVAAQFAKLSGLLGFRKGNA